MQWKYAVLIKCVTLSTFSPNTLEEAASFVSEIFGWFHFDIRVITNTRSNHHCHNYYHRHKDQSSHLTHVIIRHVSDTVCNTAEVLLCSE